MLNGHRTVMLVLGWRVDEIQRGVADYAREHRWHLVIHNGPEFERDIGNWRGDGMICALECDLVERLLDKKTHVVSLVIKEKGFQFAGYRFVREDDEEIGRIAAEYFMKRGFSHYAAYSVSHRAERFVRELQNAGYSCIQIPESFQHDQERLADWLKKLPAPCALFCENDWDAAEAVNAAIWNGIRIPEDLAILGVGNDFLICHAPAIPISSVDCRYYELGRRAAYELDRMLDGNGSSADNGKIIPIAPDPLVAERKSSEFFAVSNQKLTAILEYMRCHAQERQTVREISEKFYLSEAALYKLFMRNLGISPKKFLLERKLRKAAELLRTTNRTMVGIADDCGFATPGAMFSAFRSEFGCTPGEWRSQGVNFSP